MEETAYIEEVDQQQPDPQPKPKKLKVKDFAAKVKAKYPDYKDVDDLELTNKIIAKYPEYKDQVDFGQEVKKKVGSIGFEESSLEAGNSLSQSIGEVGSDIPTIEMYTTPNGEMVEANPIALSKKYNELSNKTIDVGVTGEGTQVVPDANASKDAAKLKEDFKELDLGGIYEETKDIPDEVLSRVGNELMQDREQNNPLYQRKLANIKWRHGLEQNILANVDNGNITPENYNRIKHSIDMLPEFTGTGDFTNQRGAIKSLAQDIQLYGGENKDKILENFAVEVSKVYGSAYNNKFSETIKDSPESKYLNEDEQLALQYIKDVSPDKAGQYDRLMVDPKTLKDNPEALKGYNHLKQTLEETGIGLQQNSVTEELNSLKKQATENGSLTEEQLKKAEDLEKKQDELTQKRNELDAKYPDRIEDKVDDALQEIMGQKIGGLNYFGGTAFNAIKNTGKGIWEAVSTPFMSDASNTLRELAIMGETMDENRIYHKTDKNKSLLTDTMVIEPELQTQIDAIKNNKVMSESDKEMKIYRLLKDNTDKFGRVPIKGGKFNVNPASIMYGLSDLTTTLLPFIGLEAITGGGATAGLARKFASTFTAAAATSFHSEYANALLSGKSESEAYKEAMGMTAISSLAMAGAGTPAKIKAMVNPKTSAGKLILSMSDDAIQKVLDKGGNKALNALKGRFKATPQMVKGGLKTGAEFEVAMTSANEAKHQIYDTEIDREENLKHSLLAIANFGILGAGLGQFGYKSPTQMQKSAGLMFGEKPDSYISVAETMRKNGQLTETEFNHRKELITKYGEAYKTLPKDLPEKAKAEYLYQTVIKNEANKGKSDLPPKQAAEAEKIALVADYKREMILDEPTDKQLNDRKGVLERKLEPKKDKDGNAEVLPEKEKLDLQAELEAINQTIESKPTEPTPSKEVVPDVVDKKGVDEIVKNNKAISDIGTKEEYSQYLDTVFPDSKVKDIVYHGTDKQFNEFNTTRPNGMYGASFTTDAKTAENYTNKNQSKDGRRVVATILDVKNPKNVSYEEASFIKEKPTENDAYIDNTKDGLNHDEYVVFDPKQIHILGSKADIEGFKKWKQEQSLSKEQPSNKQEVVEPNQKPKNEEVKVTEDTSTPTVEGKEQSMVIEPTPKGEGGKGKFEEKARKLAEKIMATEVVPDWLKIDDTNASTKGASAENIKKALADATIKMGKLLDKGVEFGEAVKEAVKDLVDLMGEGMRGKIEEGFAKEYKEQSNYDLSGIRKKLVSDKIIEGVDLERIGDKEMMALGRKVLDTGEVKPEALVTKIITDGKGVLTPTEVVGLITYKRDIDTALQDTYKQIAEKRANGEDIGTLGVEAKNLERQQNDFDVMAVITAQQQSMAFRLRQRMLDREYNVVTQIEKYKANNNGEIPADVEAKFRDLDKQIKELNTKLTEAEKKLAEKEGQEAVDNIKESVGREKKYTEEELQAELKKERASLRAEKKSAVHKTIDEMMDKWAKKITPEHLRGTGTKGIDAEKVFKSVGAIMKKAYDAGETTAKIIEDAVNYISEKLGNKDWGIDEFKKENWEEKLKAVSEKKSKDKPTINEDGTVSIPNEMLRGLVKRGVTDINDLTKEVHKEVKKDLPEITERQVRDAITDYGKKVNPTADEIQTQVNTAKRVGRLLSELEDLKTMGKVEFLAKYQKPKPSDSKITARENELRQQIKSLGKDIVGDIKGTKESDTKHQSRIEYLEKELLRIQERRRKEPKEKKESTREIPEDEKKLMDEIEKEQSIWDSEKDAARQFADDYGKMETERNRQLKRVGELNEKIETLRKGELPETKKLETKKDTPEIEALKAEKDALEKGVRESIAHEKKMKELGAELQRLKERKEKAPNPQSQRVISAEERLKRDEIEAERKAWGIEKNIENLNTELQRVRDRQKKVTTPREKRELTQTEKDIINEIKAEKEAWRKEVEPERKVREALKAAQKSLTEYERRIAEKDFSKKPESATPETPELKALREKRDAKRKEYEKLKKDTTPKIEKTEAERLKAAKESAQRRINELTEKIKNKDFAKPAKKLDVTDTELVKLNAEKEKLQEEFEKEQYALEVKNRTVWQKWEDRAYELTSGVMRGLTLGVDLSAAGVQGMRRLFTNPKRSAIAFWDGLKFLVSEKGANEFMDKQKSQPYYPLLKASKLAIDDKTGKQSVKEGMFVSEWINFLWNKAVAPVAGLGTKWGTNFVRKINPYAASQRAYDGYVNSIRIQTYLKLAKELSRDGYTYEADPKVFNKLADFVNTTTGRGSLGAADANSKWLNVFLTAPRKVISEVKLYTPYAFVYYARMPKPVRMKALKDFAQFTGTFMAVNALIWASRKDWGNEEEDKNDNFWNMNSSDFLTHKIGDKRVSIGGGMKSILTMQSRFWSGKFTDQYGETTKLGDRYGKPINTRLDLVTRFGIGKAAPVFNVLAKKLDERAGRPVENDEIIKNISVPLWLQDVGELYKNDPNSVAPLLTAFSILGANVRAVEPRKSSYTPEELKDPTLKAFVDKGINFPEMNPEKIQTKEVNNKVTEKLSDYDDETQKLFIETKKKFYKEGLENLKDETIIVYVDEDGGVSMPNFNSDTPPDLTGKNPIDFKDLTQEQLQYLSSQLSDQATEKTKAEIDLTNRKKKPKNE